MGALRVRVDRTRSARPGPSCSRLPFRLRLQPLLAALSTLSRFTHIQDLTKIV
ncbi:hypothetical protein SORBI_3002G426501 [Sorghum bicolor]|uniref:Uncharacterized protein n=1 Tax=Sorghum bicolor TaxID=4558 RepID=A0A1W0W821_SORBI|nr:hypothetical protein SORBI_3002G426501 [Sorghum bicolor]